MEDTPQEPAEVFPQKPELDATEENTLLKSVVSLLLFIGLGYLFFDKDLKFVLVLVLVVFIHEMGHFLAMKYYKYTDVKMFFIPLFGAFVTGQKQDISQKQRAIILLAGPVPGIIIGTILFIISVQNEDYYCANGSHLLRMTAALFVFLNVSNLLPVTPLDGGNLLGTLFFNRQELVQTIFAAISAFVLAALAVYLETYLLLVIPVLLIARIMYQIKLKKIKAALDSSGIEYEKNYEQLTDREYWLIREEVIHQVDAFKNIDPKQYTISLRERQIINYIKGLAANRVIHDLSTAGKIAITASWVLFGLLPIIAMLLGKLSSFFWN